MDASEPQIADTLARVLASEGFVNAPNLAAFLRYVVEETLAGRADRLKAYTIAVAALDRPDNFDPNDNPLVRVQARRLRAALGRYYETDGVDDPLIIEMPLGSYIPRFIPRETPETVAPEAEAAAPEATATPPAPATTPPQPPPAPASPAAKQPRRRWVVIAAVVLVGLLGGLTFLGWPLWKQHAEISGRTALVERDFEPGKGLDATRVLPLLLVEVDMRTPPLDGFDAESYRRRIEAFAERFDDMVVVSRRAPDAPIPPGQPLYRLHFGFVREGETANGYYQLVHGGDERIVRTGAFRLKDTMRGPHRAGSTFDTPTDLDIVRDLVQLNGAISLDTARLGDIGEPLACLVMGQLFAGDRNETLHRAARTCLEAVITAHPRLAPAYTLLAEAYLREYRRGFDRLPGDPLARAEAAARRAVALAPMSAAARQMLSEILLLRGTREAAIVAGAAAVELNAEDMNLLARNGALLARSGRYEDAATQLRRAAANMASPPSWVADFAFLALNALGRAEEADSTLGELRASRYALHLAAAAIRGHRHGDAAATATAISGLIEADPAFRDDPLAPWHKRGFAPAVAERLVADLHAAGLPHRHD